MKTSGKKKHSILRAAGALAVTLVIVAAAALFFLYRDLLLPELFGEKNSGDLPPQHGEPYTYESGASQVFAVFGNNLAIATGSGLQILDENGYLIGREYFSMKTPAISCSETSAVFFDVGGTALRVAEKNGDCVKLDTEEKIINVSVNKNGAVAVVTEESGYRARVTVYNNNLDPVYVWHSGSARVLSAQISPSGREMAVLCIDDEGTSFITFSLDRETPIAELKLPGELFLDLRYMGESVIAAVSVNRLLFIDSRDGKERGSFDFSEKNLMSYDIDGDGFALLILGEHLVGEMGEMISVGLNALPIASLPLSQNADSVRVLGKRIFVLGGATLTMYNELLEKTGEGSGNLGARYALPRANGDCLLVTAFTAERFSF